MITGLAAGLAQPFKGKISAALKRSEDPATAPLLHSGSFKGAAFTCHSFPAHP